MRLRLVDGTVYEITRADVIDGRLEIDMEDKTAEEVQNIFSVPANLSMIELMTDAEDVFGELPGWTVYGGVMLNGETKTAILTKPADATEERLTAAESNAIVAKTIAQEAKNETEDQKTKVEAVQKLSGENADQITDLQMALCELYEGMEV